jgi:hypothetical protein
MTPDETDSRTLEEYKSAEFELHRELMTICRKYIHEIGIASIIGIIDIVKNETIDLESATKHNVERERPVTETAEAADNSFFS